MHFKRALIGLKLTLLSTCLANANAFGPNNNSWELDKLAALQHVRNDVDLSKYESSVYSQNGEDGVIEKIFQMIGTGSKTFVEFGASNGYAISNTLKLREKEGWHGLLLDCDYENPSINLHKAFITAENINDLFAKYNVPYDLDLLSIDIDFNDFYVWQALSEDYQPRLIVIEYNGSHLPQEDKIVVYDPHGAWDGTNYYGVSISSLFNLGRKKGYSLVYAENRGVNLFFVRDDLVAECKQAFKNINNVEKIYRTPNYGTGPNGGHPKDPLNRPYVSSESVLK